MSLITYRRVPRIVRIRKGSLVLYRYDNLDRLKDALLIICVAAPLMGAFVAAWIRSQVKDR